MSRQSYSDYSTQFHDSMLVTIVIIWDIINVSDGQMKNMRACETDVERREQQSLRLLRTSASAGLQRIAGLYSQLLLECFQSVSKAQLEIQKLRVEVLAIDKAPSNKSLRRQRSSIELRKKKNATIIDKVSNLSSLCTVGKCIHS